MGEKWVKALKTVVRTNSEGRREMFQPGDWFQARNMEIRQRMAAGEVALYADTKEASIHDLEGCGIITSDVNLTLSRLSVFGLGLEITYSHDLVMLYPYNFFFRGGPLRKELIPIAFDLLRSWELAIPLLDFNVLAESIGTEEDKKLTLESVGDLRVPVYDTRQMFVKRCPASSMLLMEWEEEKAKLGDSGDERLAFLRALCNNPMLVLALPPSWRDGIKVGSDG